MSDVTFYRTTDGVLARWDGATTPEVWGPRSGAWRPFPDLDRYTDARVISRTEAKAMVGDADLEMARVG